MNSKYSLEFLANKKILVTGGNGFLGKHVIKFLKDQGILLKNIFIVSSKDCDLRLLKNCEQAVKDKDVVIHLAARVGGIGFNREKPAELFYDNAIMGLQLMDAAHRAGIKKFISVGTVCAYPKFTPVPFKETDLWNGYPEETNAPYGLAKKMLLVQAQAYRQQYGLNAIHFLLVNLYGPGDNFDPNSSHVIPALILKIREAKKSNSPFIEVWGSGSASREFLYVEDAAKGIILAAERYNKSEPVNLGSGSEIKVIDLVTLLCKLMDFKGEIKWDKSKPDGQPRRGLDINKALQEFSFKSEIGFEEGLKRTIDWYNANCN